MSVLPTCKEKECIGTYSLCAVERGTILICVIGRILRIRLADRFSHPKGSVENERKARERYISSADNFWRTVALMKLSDRWFWRMKGWLSAIRMTPKSYIAMYCYYMLSPRRVAETTLVKNSWPTLCISVTGYHRSYILIPCTSNQGDSSFHA